MFIKSLHWGDIKNKQETIKVRVHNNRFDSAANIVKR